MAEFKQAFKIIIANEGKYVNDPDDPGGETYKGIARKIHSKWEGWTSIDILHKASGFPANLEKDTDLQQMVERFYQVQFWDKMKGDEITNQQAANSIFDFAVNAGCSTSVSLAQLVIGAETDGVFGTESLAALNAFDPEHFSAAFTVTKIARYITIVKKRPESRKYFYGWICRALGEH